MTLDTHTYHEEIRKYLQLHNEQIRVLQEQIAEMRDELHQEAVARREAVVALTNRVESVRRLAQAPLSFPASEGTR
jgi:hypothetical protein